MAAVDVNYLALLDALPVSVVRFTSALIIDYVNACAAAQVNLPPQEIVGRSCSDLNPDPVLCDTLKSEINQVFTTGQAGSFEYLQHHPTERLLEFRLSPVFDNQGQVLRVIVAAITIEEVRRLRKALEAKEELFQTFMDNSPVIAWLRDSENRYVFLNKTYLEHYALRPEDRLGRRPDEVWPAEVAAKIAENDRAVLTSGRTIHRREIIPDSDGTPRHWFQIIFPFTSREHQHYVGGVGLDVTAEHEAEELQRKSDQRLAQARKLESLGTLAAGAAHDFNNLLTLVLGHANMAVRMTPEDSPARDHLRAIEDATEQMVALCQQMLAFAGRGRRDLRSVNLNDLVQDTLRLLKGLLPQSVAIHYELAVEPPHAFGDPTQLRQIVLNLATNAAEALGDRVGTITAYTGIEIPSAAALEEAGLDSTPRPYAVLEISDDGPGMSETVRGRIFEPFFTTKPEGHGLGLAAVQGIVRSHRGLISVKSSPGQGTAIRVLIPLA